MAYDPFCFPLSLYSEKTETGMLASVESSWNAYWHTKDLGPVQSRCDFRKLRWCNCVVPTGIEIPCPEWQAYFESHQAPL